MRRFWLAILMVLSVGFVVPSVALADDGLIDSFGGGLQTLVDPESVNEVEYDPVMDYEYEPVLREVETTVLDEDLTVQQSIEQTVTGINRVEWGPNRYSLFDSLRRFIGVVNSTIVPREVFILPAIGIVFMWWGMRKAVRMIKSAWYKGHASV